MIKRVMLTKAYTSLMEKKNKKYTFHLIHYKILSYYDIQGTILKLKTQTSSYIR